MSSDETQTEGKPLTGQTALVTGASRGIGAATAKALAAQGAHILLVARNADELEKVEDDIFDAGGSATIAPLDIADGDSVARLAAAFGERWGALDVLVLNAAILGNLGPVPTMDGKAFSEILTTNVLSQHALIAAFDKALRKSAGGKVIALTSSVGASPRAFWGGYGASKAALDTLIASYGEEMRNTSKVRTAILDPGKTRTKMREEAYPGEDPMTLKTPDIVADKIVELAVDGFETNSRVEIG